MSKNVQRGLFLRCENALWLHRVLCCSGCRWARDWRAFQSGVAGGGRWVEGTAHNPNLELACRDLKLAFYSQSLPPFFTSMSNLNLLLGAAVSLWIQHVSITPTQKQGPQIPKQPEVLRLLGPGEKGKGVENRHHVTRQWLLEGLFLFTVRYPAFQSSHTCSFTFITSFLFASSVTLKWYTQGRYRSVVYKGDTEPQRD